MIKILVAPDSFKESLSAALVAQAIALGVTRAGSDLAVTTLPLADGGEGTLDCLLNCLGGERKKIVVSGPLGVKVQAEWGLVPDKNLAIVELAQASGLELVPKDVRNALKASTYGTGQLIDSACEHQVKEILVTVGGSATTDGGMGALAALGARFLNDAGDDIGKMGGEALIQLAQVDLSKMRRLSPGTKLHVACDIDNLLLGPNGAAYVYGPQKGASKHDVELLDRGLAHFSSVLERQTGRVISQFKGSGAAGGTAAGLSAFFDLRIESGFKLISELIGLESKVAQSDLVITAEGEINSQTLRGKVPYSLGLLAKKHDVPVIALCGSIGSGADTLYEFGISSVFSIAPGPITLSESIANCSELLQATSERVVRAILSGRKLQ